MAEPATVRDLIERQAENQPEATYALLAEGGQSMSYARLAADCRTVQAWLRSHGSAPGDVVSVVMPNGMQTLRILLGAMHGGWCVNPVNLLAQPEQMRYVLAHSDCRVIFVSPDREAMIRELAKGLGREVAVIVTEPNAVGVPGGLAQADAGPVPRPDTLALLMYTSGTTGKPKGVMLTQANLVANAIAISDEHDLGAADRVLAVLPLYHINAFTVTMLAPMVRGGSLAMVPRFSAGAFWAQALDAQCTWINVVPTIVSYLLEGREAPAAASAIRFCRSASAALPPEHLRAFEIRFGIGIVETMGLTETAAPAFSNPLDPSRRKVGSVGRASGCEARVIDAASGAELADGTIGEIVIRGPNVMVGYYKNEEATRSSFIADGWLRTGDLGYRDADGFFFVTGRIKELIIKGGENIAPREIDEVLLRHPAVLEAAAVGIPDRHYGQEIMACVVPREGRPCTEDELRGFCEQHLGRYKTPKVFRFVAELPRGPSGKVQRLKLLDAA